MPSLRERISVLEADLRATPMRHYNNAGLPFAVFCYPPEQEWAMRAEIGLLQTRLENATERTVHTISLADLLWQSVDESEGMQAVTELEQRSGFDAVQEQIQTYLSDALFRPLPELLGEKLAQLDPSRHIAFIVRAGALAPGFYRVSALLDKMLGRTRVPCVLFMPATAEGRSSLRFMGIAENEGRGSYHTKVYVD